MGWAGHDRHSLRGRQPECQALQPRLHGAGGMAAGIRAPDLGSHRRPRSPSRKIQWRSATHHPRRGEAAQDAAGCMDRDPRQGTWLVLVSDVCSGDTCERGPRQRSVEWWIDGTGDGEVAGEGCGDWSKPSANGSQHAAVLCGLRRCTDARRRAPRPLASQVYNLTPYMKFHPGGEKMLMAVAGKDGTAMFNKYHPWVNIEFLMTACFLGLLTQDPEPKPAAEPGGTATAAAEA